MCARVVWLRREAGRGTCFCIRWNISSWQLIEACTSACMASAYEKVGQQWCGSVSIWLHVKLHAYMGEGGYALTVCTIVCVQ